MIFQFSKWGLTVRERKRYAKVLRKVIKEIIKLNKKLKTTDDVVVKVENRIIFK